MAEKITVPVVAMRGQVLLPYVVSTFDISRPITINAVKTAVQGDKILAVIPQKDAEIESVGADGLRDVGITFLVQSVQPLSGNRYRVTGKGIKRVKVCSVSASDECFYAEVEEIEKKVGNKEAEDTLFRGARVLMMEVYFSGNGRIPESSQTVLRSTEDDEEFLYVAANTLGMSFEEKVRLLGLKRLDYQFCLLHDTLKKEVELARIEKKVNASVKEGIDKSQHDFYLREKLKAIHKELGDDSEENDELEEKIKAKHMPEEVEKKALKELSRMSRMPSSSPDYNVLRGYIDWLLDLEWNYATEDTKDIAEAEKILNEDHYGLEKIKERIAEYLAVLQATGGKGAPVLCLVGAPGVGKTSVATSISRALGRKFVRLSLGGMRDEAEIRGHRKTYVGAMPGRIITALKNVGSVNPVFLLDEVDKISSDGFHGDPSSALLEVLDPEQNSSFRDNYLEVPFDLSKVLFITTANDLSTVPPPLLDRMEVIRLSGYTQEEKKEIAKRYLVPKRMKADGLKEGDVAFTDEGIDEIISGYTREAGVRGLERQIDAVCRKVVLKKSKNKRARKMTVTPKTVHDLLGTVTYISGDELLAEDSVGAATGLAWTAVGGVTLTVEVSKMSGGKGDILLTGQLGDVMKESARAAISYIRSNAEEYGLDGKSFTETDIHIHVPEGATPKDGPSAGITMATAILSAFTGKPVRRDVAMTGEITLRGRVLPIGGLKEKSLAAYRIGVKDIIIPKDNLKDLEDIPAEVKEKVRFIPVSYVGEVFANAIVGI